MATGMKAYNAHEYAHARSVRPVISSCLFPLAGGVAASFHTDADFSKRLLWLVIQTESEGHAIRVGCAVVVGIAVVVDIAEVGRRTGIGGGAPPVVA